MEFPDSWILCKITDKEKNQVQYRVFAGWYGGYCVSDSWKMSSPVVKTEVTDNSFDYFTNSGNCYRCYKSTEGMSSYMDSIYSSYTDRNTDILFIERVCPEII
jgi:hypothetical protein